MQALLKRVQQRLFADFSMKDFGPLHNFLGISVVCSPSSFFLLQNKYANDLLDRANMANCWAISMPVDTHSYCRCLGVS
jgi:hypothetical protein